jgi:hypothetical protein
MGLTILKSEQTQKSVVIATRGHFPVRTVNLTTNTNTRHETELFTRTGVAGATNIQLAYANVTTGTSVEVFADGSSHPFTLESSLLVSGSFTPMSYAGVRRPLVDQGASLVLSDESGVFLAPNTTFSVKTGAVIGTLGPTPFMVASCRSTTQVTKVASTSGTSQIFSNSAVTGTAISGGYALTPFAIIGIPDKPIVSLGIFGTSIDIGQGDTADATTGHLGWLERDCINVNGFPLPFVNMSRDGGQTNAYALNSSRSRFSMMRYLTHMIFGMHTNDIEAGVALATIQANCKFAWDRARTAGCKVYHTTVIPRTTSTDSWETVANQTPIAGFEPGGIAQQFNAWLLTQVGTGASDGYLDGVVDVRSSVCDPAEVWKWKPSHTTDGIHPNGTGHAAMAAAGNAILATFTP